MLERGRDEKMSCMAENLEDGSKACDVESVLSVVFVLRECERSLWPPNQYSSCHFCMDLISFF